MINITLNNWKIQKTAACLVRTQVFINEQHVPPELEMDAMDELSIHALATEADGTPIGTGRLLPDGHIGRIAVLASARGTGVGAQLVRRLMQVAKERGDQRVILSSQRQAEGFYRKLGFVVIGEEFMEAGIAHIDMEYCFDG
jgi:predicted GNAT family N-acyltransferase